MTQPHRSVSAYDDAAVVAEYDARMEVMHPNRSKMAEMVIALLPFAAADRPVVLDLGTGTGFLADRVLTAFPHARLMAIDGAAEMARAARARLGDRADRTTWLVRSFQQLTEADLPELDAVVSSFALHHLSADEKLTLYRLLRARLRSGGMLLNADIVVAPHRAIEDRYQQLRRAGIRRRLRELRGEEKSLEAIGAELAELERRDGDQPLPLETDLRLLREAGFEGVDCIWKETREAVWGGNTERRTHKAVAAEPGPR